MSKREKLRQKLRNGPPDSNLRDVQTLLEQFGFTLVRIRGSHHIFVYDDGKRWKQVILPVHRQKVQRVYVDQVIDALDELFPSDAREE